MILKQFGEKPKGVSAIVKKLGTNVAVWTQPGKLHQGEYGLKVGISVLDYYEKMFGVDYPLPKV